MAEGNDIGTMVPGSEGAGDYADLKYFSQLDKETAENKEVMDSVKGFKTASDLVKGYSALNKKLGSALVIPDENSSNEERAAFFKKLGMPENPDSYQLQNGDYKEDEIAALKKTFKEEIAFKNGLTKVQGAKVWNTVLAMLMTERNANIAKAEEIKKSFADRQNEYLKKDFPVDADRKSAVNEDNDLLQEFFNETGLKESFEKLGLVYNPEIVHKLAQYHKAQRAKGVHGSGAGNSGVAEDYYGKEFKDYLDGNS